MNFTILKPTRALGILGNKGIIRACSEIGDNLSPVVKNSNGEITVANIDNALKAVLPKIKGVVITDDYDTYYKFMDKLGGYSNPQIKTFYDFSVGMVVNNPKTKQTLLKLPSKMLGCFGVDTAVHEMGHVFSYAASLKGKIKQLSFNLMPQKTKEKLISKTPMLDQKFMSFELDLLLQSKLGFNSTGGVLPKESATSEGLAAFLGQPSVKSVQENISNILRQKILLSENNSEKLHLLKFLKCNMKEERRAYTVGGDATAKYLKLLRWDYLMGPELKLLHY